MAKPDPKKLDREAFHAYFWRLSDSSGRIRVNQSELAREMGVDRTTIVRIMRELELQGKIVKIKEGYRRIPVYKVVDPEVHKWMNQKRF